jgi:hypothetical protein
MPTPGSSSGLRRVLKRQRTILGRLLREVRRKIGLAGCWRASSLTPG